MAKAVIKKIKLDLSKVSKSDKKLVKAEVAQYIVDNIVDRVGRQNSPVSKGKFKKNLSPEYKKLKIAAKGSGAADLNLTGSMLENVEARFKGSEMSVGLHQDAGSENMLKAENHNKTTQRSLKSKVPARQFIPKKNEKFKREIMKDIKDIIDSYAQDEGD